MRNLNAGITFPGESDGGTVLNILGQVFFVKSLCDSSFSFEAHGMPGTFVPPHIHRTQDEFVYLLEGQMDLTLDGQSHLLRPGGTARMPMGMPHGFTNTGDRLVKALFWASPARKLHELFSRIQNMTDTAEMMRISATCEVDFLPPPS